MIWQCLKATGAKFRLLKPTVSLPCIKTQQDCRQQGGNFNYSEATSYLAMCENTAKIPGKPQIIAQCLKIQEDGRQREKMEVIEATMCENTTRFQESHQLVCSV